MKEKPRKAYLNLTRRDMLRSDMEGTGFGSGTARSRRLELQQSKVH